MPASQTFTALSPSTEAIRRPSGTERAQQVTPPVCPARVSVAWPIRIPDLHGLIRAGGDDPVAVRAERHALDDAEMTLERECLVAGGGVPHLTV